MESDIINTILNSTYEHLLNQSSSEVKRSVRGRKSQSVHLTPEKIKKFKIG